MAGAAGAKAEREFVIRQAEFLNGQGKSNEQIRALLGEQIAADSGSDVLDALDAAEQDNLVLGALQKHAQEMGVSSTEISRRYARVVQDLHILKNSVSGGMTSLRAHVTITAIVALVVVGVYLNFVVPQFENIFQSFGAALPALTRLVISSRMFRTLLLVIPILAIAWVFIEGLLVKKVLGHRYFPRTVLWRYFLLGPTIREHFELLRYSFIQWAMQANNTADAALDVTERVMRDISPQLLSGPLGGGNDTDRLRVAARIGTLENELKFRVDNLLIDVPLNAVIRRDRLALFFSLIVGGILGILIVSMYLPIFSLGSVL